MIPISQMEELSSERLSDLPRDKTARKGGRPVVCLCQGACPLQVKLSNELSCHRCWVFCLKKIQTTP